MIEKITRIWLYLYLIQQGIDDLCSYTVTGAKGDGTMGPCRSIQRQRLTLRQTSRHHDTPEAVDTNTKDVANDLH